LKFSPIESVIDKPSTDIANRNENVDSLAIMIRIGPRNIPVARNNANEIIKMVKPICFISDVDS
jgi:hypothetical protein